MKVIITEYWKVSKLLFVMHVILNILSGIFILAEVNCTALFIDSLKDADKKIESTLVTFGVFIICLFLQEIMNALSGLLQRRMHYKINEELLIRIFEKRVRIRYEYIEDDEKLNQISRVSENIVNNYEAGYRDFLSLLYAAVRIIGVLFVLAKYNNLFAAAVLIVSTLLGIIAKRYGKEEFSLEKEITTDHRKLQAYEEILSDRENESERHLFGFFQQIIPDWEKLFYSVETKKLKLSQKWMFRIKGAGIIIFSTFFIVLLSFIPMIVDGKITVGYFIALLNAVIELQKEITWSLTETIDSLAHIFQYLRDERAFWNMEEERQVESAQARVSNFQSLEFIDVTFSYPECRKNTLQHLSFKIEAGEKYAIVGANGAGKSTIIKLILGFYQNYQGQILLNGMDINEISLDSMRSIMGVIFQDYAKYSLSLKDNILIGSTNSEIESYTLEEVLKKVGLWEKVIGWKDGIETKLGKVNINGIDLSGGEWQRIAIARSMISDAPLLIMDEPSAALDPKRESLLFQQFKELMELRTSIVVTHRMGLTKLVDRIIVLDQGRMVEYGTFKELMVKQGLFYKMFEKQRRWYGEKNKNRFA